MLFPSNDVFWEQVSDFLKKNLAPEDYIAAPIEFNSRFDNICLCSELSNSNWTSYSWVVLHKGRLAELDSRVLDDLTKVLVPVLANEVFVVFSASQKIPQVEANSPHMQSFWSYVKDHMQASKTTLDKVSQLKDMAKTFVSNHISVGSSSDFQASIFYNVKDIGSKSRSEVELSSRFHTKPIYVGDHTILCRVLTKYLCYVESRDISVSPHLCLNGYWESWITQAMARIIEPGWTCVDIGANCGYYSLLMADAVGSTGNVLSVEPNPRLAGLLKKSLAVNGFNDRAKVSEKAVSDSSGSTVDLFIPNDYWGGGSICGNGTETDGNNIAVQTITLDELASDYPRIDLIKIDAEGAEPEIWEGMRQLVKKNPGIKVIMEFSPDRYKEPKLFLEDILNQGFSLAFVDSDSRVKDLSINDCLGLDDRPFLDLFLQRK
jgi:FkbM family methyltransferase